MVAWFVNSLHVDTKDETETGDLIRGLESEVANAGKWYLLLVFLKTMNLFAHFYNNNHIISCYSYILKSDEMPVYNINEFLAE